MTKKFQVYAQVRATRQLAGDVAEAIKADYSIKDSPSAAEKAAWQTIEDLLNAVECKLEKMDLK